MKLIKLTALALCLSSLSSCALARYALQIPGGLIGATTQSLRGIGGLAGLRLTDEAPSPITDLQEPKVAEAAE